MRGESFPVALKDKVELVSDGLVWNDLDGETVMMSVRTGKYYGLGEIGTRLWELMRRPVDVSAVLEILTEEYEVEREVLKRDVCAFLGKLAKEGLVRVHAG
jgi:PAS domain-containing protein